MLLNYKCVELKKVFVNENKDKLYMPESDIGTYLLDPDQVNKVRENIQNSSCLNDEKKAIL
jgi:hypothetical protein